MLNFHTFKISRLAAPSGSAGYKRSFQDTGLILTGYIEMSSPEFAAISEGEYGKVFQFFGDDYAADVRIGDRLEDESDATIYDVRGVLPQSDGPGRMLQLTLTLPIEQ